MKRSIFLILFLLLAPSVAGATTYYVDSTCGSPGDGTSQTCSGATAPFATIAAAQAAITGDQHDNSLLFKMDGIWREQFTVGAYGTSGHPFTIGAYGSGENPIISGASLVTSWTDNSGSYDVGQYGFEAGTTAEWTGTTDTGSKLSIVGGSLVDGTYAMKVVNDVTTASYVYKTFTTFTGTAWYCQFDWEPDATFAVGAGSGTNERIVYIENGSWGFILSLGVVDSSGLKYNVIRQQKSYNETTTNTVATLNTKHTIKIEYTGIGQGTTAGEIKVIVDGATIYDVASLDLNNTNGVNYPDKVSLGRYDSSASSAAGNMYFDNFWIDMDGSSSGVANTWYATPTAEPKIVLFNGTIGTPVASIALCNGDKKWYYTGGKLYTYGTVNPNTTYPNQIEASVRSYGMRILSGINYITVNGLTAQYANLDGFQISSWGGAITGITFTGVTAHHNYRDGIHISNDGGGYTLNNTSILNSTAYRNGLCGIYGGADSTMSGTLVRGNTVYGNVWRSDVLTKGGILFFGQPYVTNTTIEHNTSYNNGDLLANFQNPATKFNTGHGIYYDTVGTGNVVRYNTSYNNNHAGVTVEISTGVSIYYNVIYGNLGSVGISLWEWGGSPLQNNLVYNNTLYNNLYGIGVWSTATSSNQITGNIVKNNILYGNTYAIVATFGGNNDGTNGSGNVYAYNNLGPNTSNFIEWGDGVYYSTLAAWQSASSQANNLNSNPLFVSTTDFHLQSTSPAINAGTNVGLTTDYAGNPIKGLPDIGAYEYQSNDSRYPWAVLPRSIGKRKAF